MGKVKFHYLHLVHVDVEYVMGTSSKQWEKILGAGVFGLSSATQFGTKPPTDAAAACKTK